jgi:hypothetical protein
VIKNLTSCRPLRAISCRRRLRDRHKAKVFKDMWRACLSELDHDDILDWEEAFVDVTFIPVKEGAQRCVLYEQDSDQ